MNTLPPVMLGDSVPESPPVAAGLALSWRAV